MQYRTLIAAGLAALSLTAQADGEWSISAGYDYTSGDYGSDTTTTIHTVPVNLDYYNGPWRVSVTVPWISITGTGTVIPGPGGPLSFTSGGSVFGMGSSSTTRSVTNSGLGDITTTLGYAFFPASGSFFEISARAKFGTADPDKYLGTGENDYALQFDGVIGKGRVSPFFTVGYYLTGDTDLYTYNDVPYGSLGLLFRRGGGSSFGIGYDYRQATIDGTDDLQQISAFYGWQTGTGWRGNLGALMGLSDTAPDIGLNLTLGRNF